MKPIKHLAEQFGFAFMKTPDQNQPPTVSPVETAALVTQGQLAPNFLVQYVRDKNRAPIGVVVAVNEAGRVTFGWSSVKRTKTYKLKNGEPFSTELPPDTFEREKGLNIAFGRAKCGSTARPTNEAAKVLALMVPRAKKYFKGAEVVELKQLPL